MNPTNLESVIRDRNIGDVGKEMYELISTLYPICRSITGKGVRDSLHIIQSHVPLEIREVRTGTQVFDWTVPQEWNINDAYIKDSSGEKIVDFKQSTLHVVGYSAPVKAKMRLGELRKYLHTLPEHPDWIPYRTSYYTESWGFCIRERQLRAMKDDLYEVCIDTSLTNGSLSFGELLIPGKEANEVLISAHICHPSLCNDNLSGVAIATLLAKLLTRLSLRYSYRFIFIPATIGAIAWLAANERTASKVKHGLVLACAGDSGQSTYKKSRRNDAEIDRAVSHALKDSGAPYRVIDFSPFGYDERQFCSPGFNLPVGCLMRTPHAEFSEYHTSADNLDFVHPESLADTFWKIVSAFFILEHNKRYLNRKPQGEPQLGRRGIYRAVADQTDGGGRERALLWVLNQSDGSKSLLDIADQSGMEFGAIKRAADVLLDCELLKEVPTSAERSA